MQKIKFVFSSLFFLISLITNGQWEVGGGLGLSIPISGYNEVIKTGWLANAEGKYRMNNKKFAVGMKAQFVRMQNDNNPNDQFQNARMTLAPLIFTAEYGAVKGKVQPYIMGGLGISFFSFHYEISNTEGKSINNISFTMMPLAGLRFAASEKLLPFIETGFVLIADGPPQGFPKADKITGYNGITAGVNYRF